MKKPLLIVLLFCITINIVDGQNKADNPVLTFEKLWNELNKEDQQNLVDFVIEIERDNLNHIFEE